MKNVLSVLLSEATFPTGLYYLQCAMAIHHGVAVDLGCYSSVFVQQIYKASLVGASGI